MYGLPKRKHAANGGLIEGPGTGTSDSIDKQAPVGSYIMPADSTAAVGHDGLAKLGLSKKSVPVKVSNGEYEMPPEQVHAVGVQALNQLKAATHQPVAANDQGPRQFFANGGLVEDPEKRKQTSFDITNTPSARPGYDMSPTIRGAQAADDSKMQAKAVAPVVRPGYDAMPVVRSAQAAADRNMQAGAMPAATAPGAISANGAVDSAMQSGSVRNAETAQRGLLGEAITTAAGQQAIQTALTPTMPTPGNPERAARMQAQFDQPVTKGGQPTANQPVAAGIPSPRQGTDPGFWENGGNRVKNFQTGAVQTGLSGLAHIPAVLADGARIATTEIFGGDSETLTGGKWKATSAANKSFNNGLDRVGSAFDGAASSALDLLGAQPDAAAPSAAASNPYTGKDFEQWSRKQAAPASTPSFDASTSPAAASADKQDNGYRMIGTDAERGLDPGIAVKVGADGVPMFTNDKQAIAGAGGDFVASGFPRAQQSTPAGQMVAPAGSRVLASGTNASTEAQQFAQLGSVRNLNNGIGTFSQAESGDAQLAYDRNERAIAERQKMIEVSRRGQIGEGGGRVTIVRDSSRAPSNAELLNARLEARQAQANLQNQQAQLGLKRDARESADGQLNRGLKQQQLQVGNLDMADRQRIQNLYAQYESAAPGDRAALAEQIRVLTGKDQPARYAVAPGGQEYDTTAGALVNRPARVFNSQTGEFVDQQGGGQPSDISTDAKALAIRDNSKLSRDEKAAQLKALGYN